MACLEEVFVIVTRVLAIGFGRNDDAFAGFFERLDDTLVGIEAFVGDHDVGLVCGSKMSAPSRSQGLSGREREAGRLPKGSTIALILVLSPPLLRPIASSWPTFLGSGTVLMGAHDGRIDHRVFVVGVLCQMLEDTFPDTGLGPTGKARMNRLPVSKALQQVPPGHAGPVSIQNRLNKQSIVLGGHSTCPAPRQQTLDPLPFVVVQSIAPHAQGRPSPSRPPMNHSTTDLGIP
jgi:hypothetical protein